MTRMRDHITKCRRMPTWLKDLAESHAEKKDLHKRPAPVSNHFLTVDENSPPQAKKRCTDENKQSSILEGPQSTRRCSNISTFCDTMSPTEINYLQKELSKVVYATGCPLSMTENPLWIAFFKKLRPAFKLPSRDQVSNKYLNEVYKDVSIEVEKKVKGAKFLGAQFDGWSNIRNEGVVNVILTTPKPVFYKSIATTINSQTGKYLADQISEIIKEIGPDKILTICTDSASANQAAWALLKETYPHIYSYGCVAHILSLLLQDFGQIPVIARLIVNVRTIIKEIKFFKQLLAKFTEIQHKNPSNIKITLKVSAKTRFGSNIISMESMQVNKENLQGLAIDKTIWNVLKSTTRQILLGEEIWDLLDLILPLMKPVGTWITLLESDSPNLGHIVEVFIELKSHLENSINSGLNTILTTDDCQRMLQKLESRKTMALTDLHWAANILHPNFKGQNLSSDEFAAGSKVIIDLGKHFGLDEGTITNELAQFMAGMGVWETELVKMAENHSDAATYWAGPCKKTTLSPVGQAIGSMLSTSASTERSFKTESWIHDDRRNRLTRQRASKISYIAHNTRLFQEKPKKKTAVENVVVQNEESDYYSTDDDDDE